MLGNTRVQQRQQGGIFAVVLEGSILHTSARALLLYGCHNERGVPQRSHQHLGFCQDSGVDLERAEGRLKRTYVLLPGNTVPLPWHEQRGPGGYRQGHIEIGGQRGEVLPREGSYILPGQKLRAGGDGIRNSPIDRLERLSFDVGEGQVRVVAGGGRSCIQITVKC